MESRAIPNGSPTSVHFRAFPSEVLGPDRLDRLGDRLAVTLRDSFEGTLQVRTRFAQSSMYFFGNALVGPLPGFEELVC